MNFTDVTIIGCDSQKVLKPTFPLLDEHYLRALNASTWKHWVYEKKEYIAYDLGFLDFFRSYEFVDETQPFGITKSTYDLVERASSENNIKFMRIAIDRGLKELSKPLEEAVKGNYAELFELLVDNGACNWNRAMLLYSKNAGLFEVIAKKVSEDLEKSDRVILKRSKQEFINGVYEVTYELAETFLSKHAAVMNSFSKACKFGLTDNINILMGRFRDEIINDRMLLANGLRNATKGGYIDIVNMICDSIDQDLFVFQRGLEGAYEAKNFELVNRFLEKGCKIESGTILYLSRAGLCDLIKKNLHLGADYDLCMSCAARNGHIDVVKLMIENGATNFNRALKSACAWGDNMEIIELMIEHGATDFDAALHRACECDYPEYIEFFVLKGATDLRRPLEHVLFLEYRNTIEKLIEMGADSDCERMKKYLESRGR